MRISGITLLALLIFAISAGAQSPAFHSRWVFLEGGGVLGDPQSTYLQRNTDKSTWTLRGSLIPSLDTLFDLGASVKRYQDIYVKRLHADTIISGIPGVKFDFVKLDTMNSGSTEDRVYVPGVTPKSQIILTPNTYNWNFNAHPVLLVGSYLVADTVQVLGYAFGEPNYCYRPEGCYYTIAVKK